jgi:hypothetical protein
MSSAIYPDPPRLVTAVCGHGEQQRLSNARLRLTFLLFPGYSLARARVGRFRISRPITSGAQSPQTGRQNRQEESPGLASP